jgi:FeS assembly SUF system protein
MTEPRKNETVPGPAAEDDSLQRAPVADGAAGAGADADPEGSVNARDLEETIVAALRTVFDPEIPVNIYELGMIYEVKAEPSGEAYVRMTLTSPACPVAGSLPGEVETKILAIPEVSKAKVDLVWEPPWSPDMMSEAAKLQTGMF